MEREVRLTCVIAWLMWVGVVVLICGGAVVGVVSDLQGWGFHWANFLMKSGLALAAGAATMSIKAMLTNQNRMMRDAFEFGRESGDVRRLR